MATIKALAERFCAAPLPDCVQADPCATVRGPGRTGTNLMTVEEARLVLGIVLGGESCTWEEDEEGGWFSCSPEAGGRNAFNFEYGDPDDNEFEFCPYCGKTIVAMPFTHAE